MKHSFIYYFIFEWTYFWNTNLWGGKKPEYYLFATGKKKLFKSPFDLIENLFWLLSKKYQQAMQTI